MAASKAKALEKQREDVPEDWMAAKAELFGIDPPTQSLWVCGLRPALKRLKDQRWLVVGPRVPVPKPLVERLPVLERPDRVVHNTKPASLDHLKELVGIPNRALETAERIAPLAQSPRGRRGRGAQEDPCCEPPVSRLAPRPVELRHLPSRKVNFKRLRAEQRVAVHNQAFNLVYGFADPELVERDPLAKIRDYVMAQANALPVLTLSDLIVCDGETVEFSGFSSIWASNVIVEGSGQIKLGNNTKLHAYAVKRV